MIGNRWSKAALLAAVATLVLAVFGDAALADPATDLGEAESRVASAEGNADAAEGRVDGAQARYAAASRRAEPLAAAARTARAGAADMRDQLADKQREAREEIAELEEVQRQEEEDHDEEVAMGIGLGLTALVAAMIALGWGRFRSSTAVAALVRMQLARAVALCVGGGFLLIVIGAVLGIGSGLPGVLGTFLFCLGFVLPTAFLLGRHSAEVRDGQAKPLLGRERLPSWVSRSAAALLLLIGLGSLGAAIFSEEPAATPISPQLREGADALSQGSGSEEWEEARAEVTAAGRRAAGPLAEQRSARIELRRTTRQLRSAKRRLASAESDQRRFANRLAVVREREEREAIKEQEQAEQEAEEESESSGCEPGYSPCVPYYPPDVDCSEVSGSVTVTGSDPHGLDADGDGVGCE